MLLESSGVNTFYGRAHVLHDVALALARGEVLVLLGRNGAGKSTTLKTLIGLLRAASGRIVFDGHRHRARRERTASRGSASATCRRNGGFSPT